MKTLRISDDIHRKMTATRRELREGGYFHQAKLIVLRNLWLQKKGLPTVDEEELMAQYGAR
jgi:hypothetical protein